MARIVLVEFADNAEAENFVRQTAEVNRVAKIVGITESPDGAPVETISWIDAKVAAVVAKPTAWCTCAVPQAVGRRRGKRESGWTRGTTFGWWLCVHCHKPSKAMVVHFVTTMLAGANDLLPKILGTGPATNPNDRWRDEGGVIMPEMGQVVPGPTVLAQTDSRRAVRRRRRTN